MTTRKTKAEQIEEMHQLVIDVLLTRLKDMASGDVEFNDKWVEKAMKFLSNNGCHLELTDFYDITDSIEPSSTDAIPFPLDGQGPAKQG